MEFTLKLVFGAALAIAVILALALKPATVEAGGPHQQFWLVSGFKVVAEIDTGHKDAQAYCSQPYPGPTDPMVDQVIDVKNGRDVCR